VPVKRGLILLLASVALLAGAATAGTVLAEQPTGTMHSTRATKTVTRAARTAKLIPRQLSPTQAAAAKACGEMPAYTAGTVAEDSQIMAGTVTLSPFPVATFDPGRNGDVNWSMNPFSDPTWVAAFQGGGWLESLVAGYLAGAPQAAAYQARAKVLTQSWLRGVPIQDRDPATVICMSEAFPGQAWIDDQITVAVDYYAAHWMGAWNHGLKQDLELLRIGCAYPASAFGGQALTWRQTAYQQMLASFAPNPLGPAVDAQGATNEQSTGYASFVHYLWTQAEYHLGACGYHLPSWITARIALMPAFLAEATEPDGDFVQIGDTYVETAPREPRPPSMVAVYDRGYVFGRSGWGPDASFYSLRFGPGRQVHGHNDHMGLTYYARGHDLIVDAGHFGYQVDAYRDYLRSPEAASMLVLPGVPFHPSVPTALIAQDIAPASQFFEFYDTAFGGDPRYRSVYVSDQPDFVLVFDRASGASEYQQLWHLDPDLTVTTLTSDEAIATEPAGQGQGTELVLRQIALPGQVIPADSTQVVKGQVNPYQGWVSQQMLQRTPAPVVEMTSYGASTAMLTLIVPAAPGTPVTTAIHQTSGSYQLTVTIGTVSSTVTITPSGTISGL
jgi:hypothetical protein